MNRLYFLVKLFVCAAIFISTGSVHSQNPTTNPDLEKALKYHKVLQRRPVPGYLFDRFYNTYLNGSSISKLEEFLKSTASKSKNTNDQLLLAFFYAKQGNNVRAIEQFRTALKNDPSSASILYEKAVIEARTLDFETALKDLETAIKSNPKKEVKIKIAQLKAKLLVRNRETKKATEAWQKLVEEYPTDSGLLEDIIELQMAEGLFDQAEKLSDKLINSTKDPYQKFVRRLRKGDILQRSGKRKNAIEIYSSVLGDVGRDSWLEREVISQIEQIFRREDNLVGLQAEFEKLVKSNPGRMTLRKTLSKIQMESGEIDKALKTFEAVVNLTPGDRKNREAYITLLARANKKALAIKQMESLIKQYPKDAELRIQLAQLHHGSANQKKSVEAIEQFLTVAGKKEFTFLRAARMLENFKNREAAEKMYQQCVSAFPDSISASESYAAFLYKNEKKKEAISIWTKIAENGDRPQLIRVARILSTRLEFQAAFDLLQKRFDKFQHDTSYLGQLCNVAIALKKYDKAIPWSIQRVRLTNKASDLNACLAQTVQVLSKSKDISGLVKKLEKDRQNSIPLTCLLAEIYERTNRPDEAEKLLTTTLKGIKNIAEQKESVQMLARQKIRIFRNRNDWQSAAQAAEEVINLPGGRNSVAIKQLVNLKIRAGKFDDALKWISDWKRVSPGSLLPWLSESMILDRLGRYKDSISILRRAIQKFPNDPDLAERLGDRYQQNEQYNEAERLYWIQYENSKTLGDRLRWCEKLASISESFGKTESLVNTFESRRQSNPKSVEPLLALALIHRVADNYEERRQALLKATRLHPDNVQLLWEIARMEEVEGDWEKAILTLEQASKIDKSDSSRKKIANIYIKYGDSQKGFQELFEIYGGENASARDIEKLATAMISSERWDQAREFLARHTARFPDDYRLKFQNALVLKNLDLLQDSVEAFGKLLEVEQEIKGLTKVHQFKFPTYVESQIEAFRDIVPPDGLELIRINGISDVIIDDDYSRYGRARTLSSSVVLPATAEQCRLFAACYLCNMAEDLEENQRVALTNRLQYAGFAKTELLQRGVGLSIESSDIDDLLEDFPNDKTVLAFAVLSMFDEPISDTKISKKAFETFKSDYPVIAFAAAVQAAAADEKNAPLLDEAIKIVSKTKPNLVLVQIILRYLAYEDLEEADIQFSKKQIQQLNTLLMQWYPTVQNDPTMGAWMFSYVATSLKRDATPTRFLQLLDKEIAKHSQKNRQFISPYSSGFYRSEREISELPSLPPNQINSLPENVYSVLIGTDPYTRFNESAEEPDKKWIEGFDSHIQKAKHPVFKIVLQLVVAQSREAEDEDSKKDFYVDVKKSIDELLAADSTNVDAIYIAACIAAHQQRWVDSANYLEKMRNLPLSSDQRQMVDSHLIALATKGAIAKLKSKEMEPVLTSAKSAALRLLRNRLSGEERASLITVFETIGLNTEAEKLESKLSDSNSTFPGGGGAVIGGGGARTPASRIFTLVDSGKSDVAVKLIAQDLRNKIRGELQVRSMFQNEYELDELKKEVSALRLREPLLEHIKPSQDSSISKRETYAVALEIFGPTEKAIEQYRKILETNKNRDACRIRLLRLEFLKNPESFTSHVDQLQKKNRVYVNAVVGSIFELETESYKTKFATVQKLVKNLDPKSKWVKDNQASLSWLTYVESWLSGSHAYEGKADKTIFISSLDTLRSKLKWDKIPKSRLEKTKKALLQRDELHLELAKKMMEIPVTAPRGFSSYLVSLEAREKPIDQAVVDLAIKVIESKEKPVVYSGPAGVGRLRMPRSYRGSYVSIANDESTVTVERRTPLEFLARHWGLSKSDPTKQVEKIVQNLNSIKRKEEAAEFQMDYELYRASEDQFLSTAKKFMQKKNKSGRRNTMDQQYMTLASIVEIWFDKKSKSDISPLVLEIVGDEKFDANELMYSDSNFLTNYINQIHERTPKQVLPFIQKLKTTLLGSEKDIEEIKKTMASSRRTPRKLRRKVLNFNLYASILGVLKSKPQHTYFAMKETMALGSNNSMVRRYVNESELYKPKNFNVILANSNFLADIEKFDPVINQHTLSPSSCWIELVNEAKSQYWNAKDTKAIVKKYDKKDASTFGEKILVAALQDRGGNALYNIFGQHLDAVKKLPEQKQNDLAYFILASALEMESETGDDKNALTEQGTLAKSFVQSKANNRIKQLVQQVFDAKKPDDLKFVDDSETWGTRLAVFIDHKDSDQLLKTFDKISSLLKKTERRSYRSQSGSHLLNLLSTSMDAHQDLDSLNNFFVVSKRESEKEKFELTESLSYSLMAILQNELELIHKRGDKKSARSAERIIESLEKLAKKIDGKIGNQDTVILVPAFIRMLDNLSFESHADSIIQWAEKSESKGISKPLAKTLNLAATGFKHHAAVSKLRAKKIKQKDSKINLRLKTSHPWHTQMMLLLEDQNRPLWLRLALSEFMIDDPSLCESDVWKCVKVNTEGIKARLHRHKTVANTLMTAMDFKNSDSFKTNMESFAKQWKSLKLRSDSDPYAYPYSYYSRSRARAIGSMEIHSEALVAIEMYSLLEQPHMVKSVLKNKSDELESIQAVVRLIELKHHQEAKSIVADFWRSFQIDSESATYSRELHAALPEFFKKFSDPGTRYTAEVYFAALSDSEEKEKRVEILRDDRLKKLLDRFDPAIFKSQLSQELVLTLLADVASADSAVAKTIEQKAKQIKIQDMYGEDSSEFGSMTSRNCQMVCAMIKLHIKRDDFQPLVKLYKDLNAHKAPEHDWEFDQLPETVEPILSKAILQKIETGDYEKASTVLSAIAEISDPKLKIPFGQSFNVLMHVLSGKTDVLAKQFDEARKKKMAEVKKEAAASPDDDSIEYHYYSGPSISTALSSLKQVFKSKKLDETIRIRYIRETWMLAGKGNFRFGSGHFQEGAQQICESCSASNYGLDEIVEFELMTEDELLKNGHQIAEACSVHGEIWRQLGLLHAKKKQFEKAAGCYEKAIAQATKKMKMAKSNRALEYADVLHHLKRTEEAKKQLQSVDSTQLFEDNIKTYEKLKSVLGIDK